MSKISNHTSAMLTHILFGSGMGAMWAVLLLGASTLWNHQITPGLTDVLVTRAEFGIWAGGMAGALGGLIATLAHHRIEIDEQPLADVGRLFGAVALAMCLLLGIFAWMLGPALGWLMQSKLASALSASPALLTVVVMTVLFVPALLATHLMARGEKSKEGSAHHLRYSPTTKKMGFEVPLG